MISTTQINDIAAKTWSIGPSVLQAVSEISQGVTHANDRVFSIGSGIFGLSESVVQELSIRSAAVPLPSAAWAGFGLLCLIGVVRLRRR